MIYAMSDIHGAYDKYIAMLRKIHFSDDDSLFVLGDAVDRGPEPMKVLQDLASRENIYFIKGNHDAMAGHILRKLNVEITDDNVQNHINADWMCAVMDWQLNGGDATIRAFQGLTSDERVDILDFIDDAPLYETVDAGERSFVLVHSGLGNFRPDKKLREYSFDELCCMRMDFSRQYFADPSVYIVCGHTPTLKITGKPEIFHSNNNILIDCGAGWGGRLACICLDTMEEFYV